jgi:hypothetical protein
MIIIITIIIQFHSNYSFVLNPVKTKRNTLYIRHQSVPRCKHFPPRL